MAHIIGSTVSVLIEVIFPMEQMVPGDHTEGYTRQTYAARLERFPEEAMRLIEDRIFDYGHVLRVDVRD